MMGLELAAGAALRHWKLILSGIVLLGLVTALLLTRATLADTKVDLANEITSHRITKANYRIAQAQAALKAEQQRRDFEALSRRNADEADDQYAAGVADANARADAYIAAHRLRAQQCAGSEGSGPVAASDDQRSGVPPPVSAATVLVTADDVRACTGAVVYADQAREWAMTLNAPR